MTDQQRLDTIKLHIYLGFKSAADAKELVEMLRLKDYRIYL